MVNYILFIIAYIVNQLSLKHKANIEYFKIKVQQINELLSVVKNSF